MIDFPIEMKFEFKSGIDIENSEHLQKLAEILEIDITEYSGQALIDEVHWELKDRFKRVMQYSWAEYVEIEL